MNKKILIIDDQDDFCETLGSILTGQGYRVKKALNGREALEKLAGFLPDLIILDMVMPEMNGLEVCIKIKKKSSLKDIPVLMMTGFDSEDRKADSFIAGADDYITKPFKPEQFLGRVSDLLGRDK